MGCKGSKNVTNDADGYGWNDCAGDVTLHEACFFGNADFIQKSCNNAGKDAMNQHHTSLNDNQHHAEQRGEGYTKDTKSGRQNELVLPIHLAMQGGKNGAVAACLNKGAKVDALTTGNDNENIFHIAAHFNNIKGAREAFEHADRDVCRSMLTLDAGDLKKFTPLHVAVARGHLEMVQLFLDNGAKADDKDDQARNSLDLCLFWLEMYQLNYSKFDKDCSERRRITKRIHNYDAIKKLLKVEGSHSSSSSSSSKGSAKKKKITSSKSSKSSSSSSSKSSSSSSDSSSSDSSSSDSSSSSSSSS